MKVTIISMAIKTIQLFCHSFFLSFCFNFREFPSQVFKRYTPSHTKMPAVSSCPTNFISGTKKAYCGGYHALCFFINYFSLHLCLFFLSAQNISSSNLHEFFVSCKTCLTLFSLTRITFDYP